MSKVTISTLKFVGTISLGLLTGVSYTLTNLTLPPLLALPSASTAHTAFLRLQTLAKRHLRALSLLAISTLSLSFILSPKQGRHPYLLWTSATVLLSGGVDFLLRHDEDNLRRLNGDENGTGSEKMVGSDGSLSDEEANMGFERVGMVTTPDSDGGMGQSRVGDMPEMGTGMGSDVNGEEVRGAMERLRFAEMVRTVVSGMGFAMAVVGLWGDGF